MKIYVYVMFTVWCGSKYLTILVVFKCFPTPKWRRITGCCGRGFCLEGWDKQWGLRLKKENLDFCFIIK